MSASWKAALAPESKAIANKKIPRRGNERKPVSFFLYFKVREKLLFLFVTEKRKPTLPLYFA